MKYHWEVPKSRKRLIFASSVTLIGWFFTDELQPAKAFHVKLGDRIITSRRNVVRQDVVEAFKGKAPDNSGFDLRFNTGPGFKWLSLEAELWNGSRVLLGHKAFYISKPGVSKSRLKSFLRKRKQMQRICHLRNQYIKAIADTKTSRDPNPETIDIIVPCYRGLEETRLCLESIHASSSRNATPFEIVVVDDCSPEPELSRYLLEESRQGRITLLKNETNLGFVGSVNKALCLHPQRNFLLLNSDTEVYHDWLDRIAACADGHKRIASITPFSNNATLCSYPSNAEDNTIPPDTTPQELDALFAAENKGLCHDIPTGVGFCMYIRREALPDIGYFDRETFGIGYGEENDFCRRLALKGWRNVQLCDTFIYHKGAVSFNETKHPRVLEAIRTVNRLHPGYDALVQDFLKRDPAKPARARVDFKRIEASPRPRYLFISHDRGGGTYRHMVDIARYFSGKATFLLASPQKGNATEFQLRRLPEGEWVSVDAARLDFDALVVAAKRFGIDRLNYHHILDSDKKLMDLGKALGKPYDVTIHDYFYFCPRITVAYPGKGYCGLPGTSGCEACLARHPVSGIHSIKQFREDHQRFLGNAERVIVPSHWSLEAMKRHFPDLPYIQAYHLENPHAYSTTYSPGKGDILTVGILGALNSEKGADVLEAVAMDAAARKLPLRFVLFGYAYRKLNVGEDGLHAVTGRYEAGEIDSLFDEYRPDLFWFPAQWPETYSYTLSECLYRGYPVIVPDIGAFPERLREYGAGWVLPWNLSAAALNDQFLKIRKADIPAKGELNLPNNEFYRNEYLRDN